MRQQLAKRGQWLCKCGVTKRDWIVELSAPLIDALSEEKRRAKGLRQAADKVGRLGKSGRAGLDVAASETALPDRDAVLKDGGRETRDAGFDSERFEIALEQGKRQPLSFSALRRDNDTEQHGSGDAESTQGSSQV